jgi:hypothetical protein
LLRRSLIVNGDGNMLRARSQIAPPLGTNAVATPSASDPVWQKLVCGQLEYQFESLAVKVFLGSAKLQISRDGSPGNQRRLATELQGVFAKNETLKSVQNDLAKFRK